VICAKDNIKINATTNHIAMAALNNSFVVMCCQGWMSFYLLCIDFPFEMDFSICTHKKKVKNYLNKTISTNLIIIFAQSKTFLILCNAYCKHIIICTYIGPKPKILIPHHHELDCNPNHPKNYMMHHWNDLST
jgi:hypothetical protein